MTKCSDLHKSTVTSLANLMSKEGLELLKATGINLVETIGIDVIRDVIRDVLTGRNIRTSTEILTRRRIALINLALVDMFFQGTTQDHDFTTNLPHIAADILASSNNKAEEWLANWAIGLTGKGVQNILRDDRSLIPSYRDTYIETCQKTIEHSQQTYGELTGKIQLSNGGQVEVSWQFMLYLLNAVGAETLTIRGSEKSLYGKFFEKLVLGSVLHILGFKNVPSGQLNGATKVFWLSSNTERERESDATILYKLGRGVRMDIGFIGRGNSEISLDKVSRYRREIEIGNRRWYMGTIIVVDRIGPRSKINKLAEDIDGTIVQMSGGYWPKRIALTLNKLVDYKHPIIDMDEEEIEEFITTSLADVPLMDFIQRATDGNLNMEDDE